MREIIKIVEMALVDQDNFTDEDVKDNVKQIRSDIKNNKALWRKIKSYGPITIFERTEILESSKYFAAMIKVNGRNIIVGCCGCDEQTTPPFTKGLYVDNVAVLPKYQNRGVATALYKAIIESETTLYAGLQTYGGASIWASIIKNNTFRVFSIDQNGDVAQITDPNEYMRMREKWPDPYEYVMIP